jgi:hypothetical protein
MIKWMGQKNFFQFHNVRRQLQKKISCIPYSLTVFNCLSTWSGSFPEQSNFLFIICLKIKQSPMQTQAVNIWSLLLILIKRVWLHLNDHWCFFLTFFDFILKKLITFVWKKMQYRFVLVPICLDTELSWWRTVFFNGCRTVLIPVTIVLDSV